MLVILRVEIYELRRWGDFMWHGMLITLHEDRYGRSSKNQVLSQKFEKLQKGIGKAIPVAGREGP
jgi:hypothetical protein